jgi:hypothetical protein
MELLADRDPEEARQLLDPVLERMMDAVQQFPLFSLLPLSPSQQNSLTVVDGFIKVKSG